MSNRFKSVINELHSQFTLGRGLLGCRKAPETKFWALFDVLGAKYEGISGFGHCSGPIKKIRKRQNTSSTAQIGCLHVHEAKRAQQKNMWSFYCLKKLWFQNILPLKSRVCRWVIALDDDELPKVQRCCTKSYWNNTLQVCSSHYILRCAIVLRYQLLSHRL